MAVYSIKEIEKLTGIKAHTLRIWEKRYGILKPKRTCSNIRYYCEDDLKKITNIALLNNNGYKISRIARMSRPQIHSLAADLAAVDKSFANKLDALTYAALRLDEEKFYQIFNAHMMDLGFVDTIRTVINPLLDKFSMMQMTGCADRIHLGFINELTKRKCVVEIDKLQPRASKCPRFLLFLSQYETSNLSLYTLHYLIKSKGFCVIHMGAGLSIKEVISACTIYQPDFLFTVFNDIESEMYPSFVKELAAGARDAQLLLKGAQVFKQKMVYPPNVKPFQSTEDVSLYLEELVISSDDC